MQTWGSFIGLIVFRPDQRTDYIIILLYCHSNVARVAKTQQSTPMRGRNHLKYTERT